MLAETIALLLLSSQAATAPAPAANARPAPDLDQVICRAAEPVLGSRVARRRICRTRAEWMAFEDDRRQFRRDLQEAAKGAYNQ